SSGKSSASHGSASSGAGGTATTSSGGEPYPCSPRPPCPSPAGATACVGLADNTGQTKFGLRISELQVFAPKFWLAGSFGGSIPDAVQLNEATCHLDGTGRFNWLLQFDLAAGTLTSGGAKPVADPAEGYSFLTDTVSGFSLAPMVLTVQPEANGNFGSTNSGDFVMPVYLDQAGTEVVPFPIRHAQFTVGTLSADHNCVGSYNAATLDPKNGCRPGDEYPQFTNAGVLSGYILLEDADKVDIPAYGESLCALLAGPEKVLTTTKPGSSELVCARKADGEILFGGDYCST